MSEQDLLAPWTGPFGGLPPFGRIASGDFEPALESAMAEKWTEIEAIATDTAEPDFDNVIAAFERAGQTLARVRAMFVVWQTCLSTPGFQAVAARMLPRLAAFDDRIVQHKALFARISAVFHKATNTSLDPEQDRLLRHHYSYFVQQGAALDAESQRDLRDCNERLAGLQARFARNLLADEEEDAVVLEDEVQLSGVPESLREIYAQDAAAHGLAGRWRVGNSRSAAEPFLTYADDREARRAVHIMWTGRGEKAGERDNNAIAGDILRLRARKATLLGYPTYAHWHLTDTMAKQPDVALSLCHSVWAPAIDQMRRDLIELQAEVDVGPAPFAVEAWDLRYLADKLRQKRFALDLNEVRAFLDVEQVRSVIFEAANRLLGLSFRRLEDVPVYHPDVIAFEVLDRAGAHIGVFYVDPFARPGKASGAWMNCYRDQSRADGPVSPIVSNNMNVVRPAPGRPTYISFDDARIMFHEMGHAIHGLLSSVHYARFSGVKCARDFVEFPSQFFENYFTTPEVLATFVNADGEPMPRASIDKMRASSNFGRAFIVLEAQACAIADLALHIANRPVADPTAYTEQMMRDLGLPSAVAMRHRIPQFAHVFGDEGYAARYYSYVWSEVIAHDVFAAFVEEGGPWHPPTADRMRAMLLGVGGSVDPEYAFRSFRGRDPDPGKLVTALALDAAA